MADRPESSSMDSSTRNSSSSAAASSRVLQKLETAMNDGNFYEAHQMFRTLYFRYVSQPQRHDELIKLLYEGATRLFDSKQTTSGCDLSLLFVEVLEKTSRPIDESILYKIEGIFERLIRASKDYKSADDDRDEDEIVGEGETNAPDAANDRDLFVSNLIKWSQKLHVGVDGSNGSSKKPSKYVQKFGDPRLHSRLAAVWWRMGFYERARYHFMLSDDGEGCASFLIEYHQTKGNRSEVDMFVAQAVLKFLCHKNKSMANTVFFRYAQLHPLINTIGSSSSASKIDRSTLGESTISKNSSAIDQKDEQQESHGPLYSMPLLNFLWLLLLCVDTGRVTDYSILVEQYQPSIKRDPSYNDYLDRIGQLYFGLPPPQKKNGGANSASVGGGLMGGGFLKNLMSGLLGNDEEEEEDLDDDDEDGGDEDDDRFQSVPGTPTRPSAAGGGGSVGLTAAKSTTMGNSKLHTDETLD